MLGMVVQGQAIFNPVCPCGGECEIFEPPQYGLEQTRNVLVASNQKSNPLIRVTDALGSLVMVNYLFFLSKFVREQHTAPG